MRKGTTRTTTIVDQQIVLKYVKNSSGSYNVYGKGQNEMGTFDLLGTLILQGKANGLMQLYRLYPTAPIPEPAATGTKKSSKVFQGGLTEKATPANSGPAPAMNPPERFIPSTSGLLRRESARMSRLPSRLEEDDPQAAAARLAGRSWSYLKRSHLHANGLGTSALAMILLSAGMTSGAGWKRLTAYLLGIGALGYSTFWMLAAFRAPALGGTDLAKESLSWLAMPTAVCCLVGLALVLIEYGGRSEQ